MNNYEPKGILNIHRDNIEIAGDKSAYYTDMVSKFIFSSGALSLAYLALMMLAENLGAANSRGFVIWMIAIFVCFLVHAYMMFSAHDYDYKGNQYEIMSDIRIKMGTKLKNMPLKQLYKYRTGELNSVFSGNVEEAMMSSGIVAGMFLEIVWLYFMVLAMAFIVDYRIGLIMLTLLPVSYPLYKKSRISSQKAKSALMNANRELEAEAVEYVQGLAVLKSLNKAGMNSKKLSSCAARAERVQEDSLFINTFYLTAVNSFIDIVMLAIFVLGQILFVKGEISIYLLAVLIFTIIKVSEPLSNFLAVAGIIDLASVGLQQVKSIIATEELDIHSPKAIPSKFDIEFQDVSFSYEEDPVLKKVSLHLPEKSFTAIVGPSGSGKTTITRMITRYDDPEGGRVLIGGVDIRNIETADLMQNISVVFQDVYLFDDTILENIRVGRRDATDQECLAAASLANCDEFINYLENGYNTVVGEIGASLSGGERQRISIARAILKDAPIVILDEPTSALDTSSEVEVQKALNMLVKNKTIIVIAHRLSTITGADQIIVLEDGEIAESGTHRDLIKSGGRYHSMQEAGV